MSLLNHRIPVKTSYLTTLLTPTPSFEQESNTSLSNLGMHTSFSTDAYDKSIYSNVLIFPQGTEHLKYFEKNPHPDRFPPELQDFMNLYGTDDLNISTLQRQMEFDRVKKSLKSKLSETDERLLVLPAAVQGLLDKEEDKNYRTAYKHLQDGFLNYFSTPVDPSIRPDIQWLPFSFLDDYYPLSMQ